MASKRESLLEYLKTLFSGVTKENGYNVTINTVARGIRNIREMSQDQLPALFITMTHEKRQNITHADIRSELQVVLVGYVQNSKGDLTSSSTGVELDIDKMIEDVTEILETDRLQGGRVYGTEITDIVSDDGDLFPVSGFVMSVTFFYATGGTNI